MFTGRGGISSELMIFNVIIFALWAEGAQFGLWASWNADTLVGDEMCVFLCVCPYVQYIYCDDFLNIQVKIPHDSREGYRRIQRLINEYKLIHFKLIIKYVWNYSSFLIHFDVATLLKSNWNKIGFFVSNSVHICSVNHVSCVFLWKQIWNKKGEIYIFPCGALSFALISRNTNPLSIHIDGYHISIQPNKSRIKQWWQRSDTGRADGHTEPDSRLLHNNPH